MQGWEYRVAYVDFHGRVSVEGQETTIGDERKTAFVRRTLDDLGREGWELAGVQPVSPHGAYYVFKRPTTASSSGSTP
ncbi:MAG: hypothetical protein OJF49_004770 [Ktedonobacterales bacterium]|jgi:hypothetical protein|nr:MAG: hypothetical protein OJF49_004770 [Ktedonobacterales bacterium]